MDIYCASSFQANMMNSVVSFPYFFGHFSKEQDLHVPSSVPAVRAFGESPLETLVAMANGLKLL